MKKFTLSILLTLAAATATATTPVQRAKPITNPDGSQATTLLVCGGTYVSAVQPDLIPEGEDYQQGIIWDFDARDVAFKLGLGKDAMDHLDDCKPIDGNTRILATSSHNWALIVTYDRKRTVEFWTAKCNNAHSAEVLPGNLVVVACATPTNQIQLYDRSQSNEVLQSIEHPDVHGVVWNEKRRRLYAIGKQELGIYRLEGADTPQLVKEATVKTPQSSCHDLSTVDENTLCVSGRSSYFFDIDTQKFTELTQFNGRRAIKSVNYNPTTNEAWYTDATDPEGSYSWSTQTVHHTPDPMGKTDDYTFRTNNYNLYKVRVLYWGGEQAAGVEAVANDRTDTPAEYYNLQGIPVANPSSGGIYLRRQGNTTDKVLIP